jgi:hypothetical protein
VAPYSLHEIINIMPPRLVDCIFKKFNCIFLKNAIGSTCSEYGSREATNGFGGIFTKPSEALYQKSCFTLCFKYFVEGVV